MFFPLVVHFEKKAHVVSRKSLTDRSLHQRPVSKRYFNRFTGAFISQTSKTLNYYHRRRYGHRSVRRFRTNPGVGCPLTRDESPCRRLQKWNIYSSCRYFYCYRVQDVFQIIVLRVHLSSSPRTPSPLSTEPAAMQSRKIHGVTADTWTVSRAQNEFESPPSIF